MLLMAMATGTGLLPSTFFKLSEGSLSNVCLGMDMCICERLLEMCPALLLTYTNGTNHSDVMFYFMQHLIVFVGLQENITVTLCGSPHREWRSVTQRIQDVLWLVFSGSFLSFGSAAVM